MVPTSELQLNINRFFRVLFPARELCDESMEVPERLSAGASPQ